MNNEKVIYNCFGYPFNHEVAVNLERDHGWTPVYWNCVSDSENIRQVKAAFPDIIIHHTYNLRSGKVPRELSTMKQVALDKKVLNAISPFESCVMQMLDRFDTDGRKFTYIERRNYYYKMLRYWLSVIDELNITLMLSWVIPHHASDYILYLACQYKCIPTLMINVTPVLNNYFLINDTICDYSSQVEKARVGSSGVKELSFESKQYLEKLRGTYKDTTPFYMAKSALYSNKNAFQHFITLVKDLFRLMIGLSGIFKSGAKYKKNFHSYSSKKSNFNRFELRWYRYKALGKIRKIKKVYDKHVTSFNPEKKYIYFAASYQPERTTLPDAHVYSDLFLILDIVSKSIPSDWVIYYKEHPACFSDIFEAYVARNKDYYERISSISNIKIISEAVDTFSLIDHSEFVVSATGTVAWESLVRRKSVLVFGATWFGKCAGVYEIESIDECKQAVEKIISGVTINDNDIINYCAAAEYVGHKDLIIRDYRLRINNQNAESEMQKVANAFYGSYKRLELETRVID